MILFALELIMSLAFIALTGAVIAWIALEMNPENFAEGEEDNNILE